MATTVYDLSSDALRAYSASTSSRTLLSKHLTAAAAQVSRSLSGDSMDDSPVFSRPANPDRQFVEVRPLLPIEVVAVLDAIAIDEGTDRTKVVARACQEFAARHQRRATLIVNASRGNPAVSDWTENQS